MTKSELPDNGKPSLGLTTALSVGIFGTIVKDNIRGVVDFNNIAANCYFAYNSGFCELLSNDSAPDAIQGFFVNAGLIFGLYFSLKPEDRQRHKNSIVVTSTAFIPVGMAAAEVMFSIIQGSNIRIEDVVTETIGAIGSAVILGAIFHFGAKK